MAHRFETIEINYLHATADELAAAERKKARFENAGYTLVHTTTRGLYRTVMHYRIEA